MRKPTNEEPDALDSIAKYLEHVKKAPFWDQMNGSDGCELHDHCETVLRLISDIHLMHDLPADRQTDRRKWQ